MLSASERAYITASASHGTRTDARSPFDARDATLETGVLPHASGSCLLRVSGGTHVLVGVEGQIGSLSNDLNAEEEGGSGGRIECVVEWYLYFIFLKFLFIEIKELSLYNSASQTVINISKTSSNASAQATYPPNRLLENRTNQLSQILNSTLNSHGVMLEKLGVVPGESCWVIRVDVLGMFYRFGI